uniref:Uncharacterized protein n=1 Tax=Oryza glumipatula TaxID=40148 RepID=A0A0E0BG83_9ORYZ
MEPPHLLRKVDPRTSDASNSKGNCQLGSQKSAERNGIPYLERKKKGCSSFNSLARFMRHKIVKYLLACMPRPSTFFLDVSEQVYIGLVWSVQMCRSIDNRSTGLEFVSRGFIPTALTWEEEEANTLGQAGAGRKRLTGPRQKGGKEIGFPLQLMHLKEAYYLRVKIPRIVTWNSCFAFDHSNVLIEPAVHDIFARIPGYGFVHTFYIQDAMFCARIPQLEVSDKT